MNRATAIVIAISAFAAGALTASVGPTLLSHHVDTGWRQLTTAAAVNHFGVSYSTEVVFGDLPPGDIKRFAGRGKFIEPISKPNEQTEFGYVVTVQMTDPDRSKIPAHYLQRKRPVRAAESAVAIL